jgi:uncharacterized membrane protein YeiB
VASGRVFQHAIDRVLLMLEQMGGWALTLISILLALYIAAKWMQRQRFLRKMRLARVTPEEVAAMIVMERPPIIVDVRSGSAQRRDPRRLPNALVIPGSEIAAHVAELPRDREVILYCT